MVGSVSKILIAYVIREHEDPLPEATEPPFGAADSHLIMNFQLEPPIYQPVAGGVNVVTHYYSLGQVVIWKTLYQIYNGTMYYSYTRQ